MSEEEKTSEEQATPETEEKEEQVEEKDSEKLYGDEKKAEKKEEKEEKPKEEKSEEKPKDVEYKLTSPEGSLLSEDRIKEIASYAKENNLDPKVAQTMVDRENNVIKQYQENAKQQLDNLADVEWPKEAKADKEIGGDKFNESVELAKRAFKKFGSEKFNEIMNETGYGNHVEVIRAFARIGKLMADDNIVHGGSSNNKTKSAADIFYGDTKKD